MTTICSVHLVSLGRRKAGTVKRHKLTYLELRLKPCRDDMMGHMNFAPHGRLSERGGKFAPHEDATTHRAVARAIFEGKAGVTCEAVAAEIGLAASTIRKWKAEAAAAGAPWRVQRRALPHLSGRAAEIADKHTVTLAEMEAGLGDEHQHEAERRTADLVAADARAEVVTRHRIEWQLVRKVLYEAVKSRDLTQAKLAHNVASALELTQRAERRAWGLDSAALGPGCEAVTVVIERACAPP